MRPKALHKATLQRPLAPPLPHGSWHSCGHTHVSVLSPSWPRRAVWDLCAALACREAGERASCRVLPTGFLGLSLWLPAASGLQGAAVPGMGQVSQVYPQIGQESGGDVQSQMPSTGIWSGDGSIQGTFPAGDQVKLSLFYSSWYF